MYKHKGRREYERWEDFIICKVKSLTRRRHVLIILLKNYLLYKMNYNSRISNLNHR